METIEHYYSSPKISGSNNDFDGNIWIVLEKKDEDGTKILKSPPVPIAKFIHGMSNFANKLSPYIKNSTEIYYISAIRNLLKRINLLELNLSYTNEEINDSEYENELKSNKKKYLIELKNYKSEELSSMIPNILYVYSSIGNEIRDLSIAEVSKLFNINPKQLCEFSDKFKTSESTLQE